MAAASKTAVAPDRAKTAATPKRRDRARTSYSTRVCGACRQPGCGWVARCTAPAAGT